VPPGDRAGATITRASASPPPSAHALDGIGNPLLPRGIGLDALARIAQGATLVTAILVGADQIGIKVTWLAILAAIVLATLLGGILIAVSLGARGYVSNLIGAHYLRQAFRIGERVRVAGFEGRIVEVTPTSLVIATGEGRVSLPGRVYHDEPILLLAEPGDG
jgi:small-conductance mechanosensitive channel